MTDLIKTNEQQNISLNDRLKALSEVKIQEVDPEGLVDISTVKISQKLPVLERIKDYLKQVKNPYCYRSHGVVVKISFAGTRTLEECIGACISMES